MKLLPLALMLGACAGDKAGDGLEDSPIDSPEDLGPLRTYACGWTSADPGDLVATGNQPGEVMTDLTGVDQCGDEYHVWDGYGRVTLIVAPPFW